MTVLRSQARRPRRAGAKDENGVLIPNVTFLRESKDASFVFVRVNKRPGPKTARATVQVDCVLRRKDAKKTAPG